MPPPQKPKKPTRRPRGTGTIFYSDARKVWVGRVLAGKTAGGRPCYIERSAKTQKELLDKLAAASPPGPDTTVTEWG